MMPILIIDTVDCGKTGRNDPRLCEQRRSLHFTGVDQTVLWLFTSSDRIGGQHWRLQPALIIERQYTDNTVYTDPSASIAQSQSKIEQNNILAWFIYYWLTDRYCLLGSLHRGFE